MDLWSGRSKACSPSFSKKILFVTGTVENNEEVQLAKNSSSPIMCYLLPSKLSFFSGISLLLLLLAPIITVIALKCYSCSYSMLELTPENDDFFCANESLAKMDRDATVRTCAPWEKFCVVSSFTDCFFNIPGQADTCT